MPKRLTSSQKQANGPSSVMANWPATSVEMWELSRILPYENNPRKHPPAQIALLAGSMLEEGVTMPILVDEAGVILAASTSLMMDTAREFFAKLIVGRSVLNERPEIEAVIRYRYRGHSQGALLSALGKVFESVDQSPLVLGQAAGPLPSAKQKDSGTETYG